MWQPFPGRDRRKRERASIRAWTSFLVQAPWDLLPIDLFWLCRMAVPPCCRCVYSPSAGLPAARAPENTLLPFTEKPLASPPSTILIPLTSNRAAGRNWGLFHPHHGWENDNNPARVTASTSKIETSLNQPDDSHTPSPLSKKKSKAEVPHSLGNRTALE